MPISPMEPDQLSNQFKSLAIVDVLGVVSPSDCGAYCSFGDDLYTLTLTFDAWRVGSDNIQTKPLHISQKGTKDEVSRTQNIIIPYSVIHIKVQFEESDDRRCEAYLDAFVGIDTSDPELNHYSEELQKPVTFEDSMFGTFTLDRGIEQFEAEVVWDGELVFLYLSEIEEVQEILKTAYAIYEEQDEWNSRIKNYAVQELLLLKNESWIDDDEVELSPDEFKARMVLESITVNPNGLFEFCYDDGGIFWGHSIMINGNILEGLTHTDICG